MSVRFISSQKLISLLERLRKYGNLEGPVRGVDGVVRFAPLTPETPPDLSALRTLLPVKKYLLHSEETLYDYSPESGYQSPPVVEPSLILFALHPCDLAGINYLDLLFCGDAPDPLYAARRSKLTLIGLSCQPDEFCSCHLFPTPLHPFSDLFLQVVDGGFIVSSGSLRGDELLHGMRDIIEEYELPLEPDTRRFFASPLPRGSQTDIDNSLPEWDQLAERCLACGACSICCPTCACFDILEYGALDGTSAERVRRWDNCLLKSHSQVAGGHSFNKDRAERLRYRYRHKYRGFGPLKGVPSCVGCGRCRVECPAELDLRDLALRLEGSPI